MGIRFRCHHCEFELHVKDFQAGKRGKCPTCKARFRIPLESSEYSLDADVELEAAGVKASESAENASQDGVQASHATSDSSANEAASVATLEAPFDVREQAAQEPAAQEPAAQEPASQERSTEQPDLQSGLESASPSTIAPPAQTLVPDRFREAPEAKWYVRPPTGGQYGPASLEDFEQWLSEKRVTHDSLIWREGWPEWLNAAKALPELFTTESPASLMPAAPALAPTPTSTAQQPASSSVTGLNAIAGQGLAGQHSSVNSASVTIEKNRIEKKRRKKRNYTVMIAVLSVIAIVLIAALIIVLMYQGN